MSITSSASNMFKDYANQQINKGKEYAAQKLNNQLSKLTGQVQGLAMGQPRMDVNLNDYPEFVQSVVDSIKKSKNNGYLSGILRSEFDPKIRAILHKIADLPMKQLLGAEKAVDVKRGFVYGFKKTDPVNYGGVSTRRRKRSAHGRKSRKH